MKTSGSLLSPSSSRWRSGHHCLSSDGKLSVLPSGAQPPSNHRDSGGALTVMHSCLQITSTKEQMSDWASHWIGAYGQFYTVLAATCPVTVLSVVVSSMYYTVSGILHHKSTENMYTCTLDGVRVDAHGHCMYVYLDNRYMEQYILFIMWPFNMYFAQMYILSEMSYGKLCPDLGT